MPVKEYRLTQFIASDREVLKLLDDATDDEGLAESAEAAAVLWPKAMNSANGAAAQATRAFAQRLSYMSALGIVERWEVDGKIKWGITDLGREMLIGKLRAPIARGLDEMDTAQSVIAMQALALRARDRDMEGTLMARAFRFSSQRR